MNSNNTYIFDSTNNFLFSFDNRSKKYKLADKYTKFVFDNAVPLVDKTNPLISAPENLPDVQDFIENPPTFMSDFLKAINVNIIKGRMKSHSQKKTQEMLMLTASGRTVGNSNFKDDVAYEPFPFDPQSIFSPLQTYATWQFAWWREVLQNAIDAIKIRQGKSYVEGHIEITYTQGEQETIIVVRDNGIGMSKNTLYSALLSFGGTGKRDPASGATGGFGKAKELIFVPWIKFKIETTYFDESLGHAVTTTAQGRHFDRQTKASATVITHPEISDPDSKKIGTTLTVIMGKEAFSDMDNEVVTAYDYRVSLEALTPIIERSYVRDIKVTVNGKKQLLTEGPQIVRSEKGGKLQDPYIIQPVSFNNLDGTIKVYVDRKKHANEIYVRQNGLYMFSVGTQPDAVKGTVRIECSGSALALFTDNRDGLKLSWFTASIVEQLSRDGEYGLKKNRGAFEIVVGGTDISKIQNNKLKEIAEKAYEQVRIDDAELLDKLLVDSSYAKGLSETMKMADEAEQRRETLENNFDKINEALSGSVEIATEDLPKTGVPEFTYGAIGKANIDTIKESLENIPVRVTGKQYFENCVWEPQILYRSTIGKELILPEYMIQPNKMPERYPFILLNIWTELCRLSASAIGVPLQGVSTGFIFAYDEDDEIPLAQYYSGQYGHSLLINPTEVRPATDADGNIIYTGYGDIKAFKQTQRHTLGNQNDRSQLLASAIHEVTHLQGYRSHDARFASAMTYNMGVIFPRATRMLNDIYKRAVTRYNELAALFEKQGGILPQLSKAKAQQGRRKRIDVAVFDEYKNVQPWEVEIAKYPDEAAVLLTLSQKSTGDSINDYPPSPIYIEVSRDIIKYYTKDRNEPIIENPMGSQPPIEWIISDLRKIYKHYTFTPLEDYRIDIPW